MKNTTKFRSYVLAGASAAALLSSMSLAHAGAFALREQSALGQGMSFAGVAAGSAGVSSMFWNPATITMNPGFQTYASVSLLNLDAKITGVASVPGIGPVSSMPSGQLGELAAIPATSVSYQLTDSVWIGMTTNAPLGLVTKPRNDWAGQLYGRTSKVFSINFNPVIGIKVTDWLSVAAGPSIEYIDVKLRKALGVTPGVPSATLRGDDVDFGYTVGATITPFAGTSIGVGYRSSIGHDLKGDITAPVLIPGLGATRVPIKATFKTPDTLTVGLTQEISPVFRMNLGYEFANWSRAGTIPILGAYGPASGLVVSKLPLNYKDGHFVSVGGEYDLSRQWTVRAGLAYEWSPVADSVRSVAVPDANRIWASIGASYRVSDKITIDAAYTHVFAKKGPIGINPGDPYFEASAPVAFNGMAKGSVDIVSLGLKYRWDDVPAPRAAAVVARY